MTAPLLAVEHLCVSFKQQRVVNDISFTIAAGETFALVGESGSGKSITALSVLGLLPMNAQRTADKIALYQNPLQSRFAKARSKNGTSNHPPLEKGEQGGFSNLLHCSEQKLCAIRGRRVGFIFQDPMSSLNPVMTIGAQIAEVLQQHFALPKAAIDTRVLELLAQVEIPQPAQRVKNYPHQLSGGQRQRVMIAIALAGQPDLLIADEPTTALDVTIQAQILTLLKTLQQQTGMALWLISHDLALVSTIADQVAVMQQGKIVETATSTAFFQQPKHPYTRKLLAALPSLQPPRTSSPPVELTPNPLLQVTDFCCYYPIKAGLFKRVVAYVKAVDGVSFTLAAGKTLALVGESGCGKTTLGKSLLSLIPASSGEVIIDGVRLNDLSGEALRQQRATMQIVFQDPFAAMNPRLLVGEIIAEGLRALRPEMSAGEREARVRQLLQQVDLPEEAALRYPHEFSGGQRQRICIARALAVEPKLIVCDEPTSALDVTIQAQIIQLLQTLQREQGVSYLFISHDLAVVARIADEVAVMYQGKIVEHGQTEQVLTRPQHAYTQKLLAAVPVLRTA